MRVSHLIQKKKEGKSLNQNEISYLVRGFTEGSIPDYQMSAYLMACYFRPPDFQETLFLTKEMLHSGQILDFSDIPHKKIDKHSTGGVGDKTSFIVAPIVASYPVAVPMVAGRGLGHTGGTLDKLESIPGFNVGLSIEQFRSAVKKNGLAMMGQTKEFAPADAAMYALRDVTATVDCIPLIVASIMSKKLAAGTDGIVLDVKYGKGAFMRTLPSAKLLAKWLVKIGGLFGKKMVALVTNMNQPLGNKLGNSLEIEEAVEILRGEGPHDLKELSLALSAQMLCLGGVSKNFEKGVRLAKAAIQNGMAFKKFEKMVGEQGGNIRVLHSCKYLPKAQKRVEFFSRQKGYLHEMDARLLGNVVSMLGGGRQRIDETIDHSVGVVLHKKVGDAVSLHESLLTLHYNDEKKREAVEGELDKAFVIKKEKIYSPPLIRSVVVGDSDVVCHPEPVGRRIYSS